MIGAEQERDNNKLYAQIADNLGAITKNQDKFLKVQPEICDDVRQLINQTYRATLRSDVHNAKASEILPELVVDEDMDEEQIWQQLEIRNAVVFPQFVERIAKLMALNEEKFEIHLDESDNEDVEDDDDDDEDEASEDDEELSEKQSLPKKTKQVTIVEPEDEDDDDEEEFEQNEIKSTQKIQKSKGRKSIVDDKFFKLSEMEAFLEQEDQKELNKQKGKQVNADGFDYFAEDLGEGDEDSDEDNANYGDFFDEEEDLIEKTSKKPVIDKKTKQKDHFDDEEQNEQSGEENDSTADDASDDENAGEDGSDSEGEQGANMQPASGTDTGDDSDESNDEDKEEEETEEQKSSFEMREQRLQQRIRDYEEIVLGEKPWQLRGEVKAANRPENSLLEEILEFESNVRPAPVITEATTHCLEDIIRQRIKDQAYDDVVRTVRPTSTPQELRKQLVLDQEKSKESLAQIYEKDYQRELDKINPNRDDGEVEPESKQHLEIKRRMRELFIKLDALSNFHFTPKPVAPEPKIITNTPAVAMEEVAPVAVSDAKLLAPEEVYRGPKNGLLGKTERNRTDKNRERRKKKQKQRAIHQAIDARELERQKQGKPLSKKVEGAKLLKSITKHRNVQTITTSNDQGALKSSKSFFNKLQDTTNNKGNVGAKRAAKKPHADPTRINAKKLKL